MGNLYPDLSKYSHQQELFKRACDAEYDRIQSLERIVVERDFTTKDMEKLNFTSRLYLCISCVCSIIVIILALVLKLILLSIPFLVVAIILFAVSFKKKPVADAIYLQNVILPEMDKTFPEYEYVSSMIDIGTFCPSAKEFAPYYGRNRRRINYLSEMGIIERDKVNDITNILLMDNDERQAEIFSIASHHQNVYSEEEYRRTYSFKGTVFAIEHQFSLGGIIRVVSSYISQSGREVAAINIKCYQTPDKIETTNQKFNDNFEIYTNSKNSAFYVLTNDVMEKLLGMKKKYGNFALAVTNTGLYISFKDFDKFIKLPKTKEEIDYDTFTKMKDNVQDIYDTIDDLINIIDKKNNTNKISIKL